MRSTATSEGPTTHALLAPLWASRKLSLWTTPKRAGGADASGEDSGTLSLLMQMKTRGALAASSQGRAPPSTKPSQAQYLTGIYSSFISLAETWEHK